MFWRIHWNNPNLHLLFCFMQNDEKVDAYVMDEKKPKSVNQRIAELVQYYHKGNKAAFAKVVGISYQRLGAILGSRQSAPTVAILQKIGVALPQVQMDWLVLGEGDMLQANNAIHDPLLFDSSAVAAKDLTQRLAENRKHFDVLMEALIEERKLSRVYRIGVNRPMERKLADRLSITEEEARALVLSGQVRSQYSGHDNDKARRNVASYLITEQAVRDFLAAE
ncbi:hypothetical protein H8B15_17485 [Hymenobacter sp. BT507]|uniref:XRE family transcriptional regulator n=1 Tax=Hymenobacter citatus TaxID=2763506 RepID=A0ABR7MP95_9BACT|nr:hypothetical protein [Hymenobacter citatus]MBC6612719.1 hypothetical protein [Hymenobacter citatus]